MANLQKKDLMMPLHVVPGLQVKQNTKGYYEYSLDELLVEVAKMTKLGLINFVLRGPSLAPTKNDAKEFDEDSLMQEAIQQLKQEFPKITLFVELNGTWLHENQNKENLAIRVATTYAESGADGIIPCALNKEILCTMREGLDEAGFTATKVISDLIAYDSNLNDKRAINTKIPITNSMAAIKLAQELADCGVAMLFIQPAMLLLDVIKELKNQTNLPIIAYQSLKEQQMLHLATKEQLIAESSILENIASIKRAGADLILTYDAPLVASLLA